MSSRFISKSPSCFLTMSSRFATAVAPPLSSFSLSYSIGSVSSRLYKTSTPTVPWLYFALPAVDGAALLVGAAALVCVTLATGITVAVQSDTPDASYV